MPLRLKKQIEAHAREIRSSKGYAARIVLEAGYAKMALEKSEQKK
jgi:hypothetical protein